MKLYANTVIIDVYINSSVNSLANIAINGMFPVGIDYILNIITILTL